MGETPGSLVRGSAPAFREGDLVGCHAAVVDANHNQTEDSAVRSQAVHNSAASADCPGRCSAAEVEVAGGAVVVVGGPERAPEANILLLRASFVLFEAAAMVELGQ